MNPRLANNRKVDLNLVVPCANHPIESACTLRASVSRFYIRWQTSELMTEACAKPSEVASREIYVDADLPQQCVAYQQLDLPLTIMNHYSP